VGSKRDNLKRVFRKTVKWGGAGLTVLLVVVWIGSGWYGAQWLMGGVYGVTLIVGQAICFKNDGSPEDLGIKAASFPQNRFDLQSSFDWENPVDGFVVQFPLWLPALLSLLATAAAWRADAKYLRRARMGLCAGCGYDRAGLAAMSVCPECGAAPSV